MENLFLETQNYVETVYLARHLFKAEGSPEMENVRGRQNNLYCWSVTVILWVILCITCRFKLASQTMNWIIIVWFSSYMQSPTGTDHFILFCWPFTTSRLIKMQPGSYISCCNVDVFRRLTAHGWYLCKTPTAPPLIWRYVHSTCQGQKSTWARDSNSDWHLYHRSTDRNKQEMELIKQQNIFWLNLDHAGTLPSNWI